MMTDRHTPDVTVIDLGTVKLGRTTYDVQEQRYSAYVDRITGTHRDESAETYLIGPRGGRYLLRAFLGEDDGTRQVISMGSGQPLRVQGNEVRVVHLGDMIEVKA